MGETGAVAILKNRYGLKLGSKVRVRELDMPGRISAITLDNAGIQFRTRYFWDGVARDVWFYGDELDVIPDEGGETP